MIIEGAFYKLPELLLGHTFPHEQYEAGLIQHLAMAVLLQLNARNIAMAQSRIQVERPFPLNKFGPANRVDLYVDLSGVFTRGLRLSSYGVKPHNWIEAKFYGSIGRSGGSHTKVRNAGRIARDLLRLCLLVTEESSRHRENSRYMLVVFNRKPATYLAFDRGGQKGSERIWLRQLLSAGRHQKIEMSTQGEAASFFRGIEYGGVGLEQPLRLVLDAFTYTFEPAFEPSKFLYWGYLVRIINFTISMAPDELVYDDSSDAFWSAAQVETQQRLAQLLFGSLLGGD